MSLVTITADLPNLDSVVRAVNDAAVGAQGSLPYTARAIRDVTTQILQKTWIDYASGQDVTWSGGTFRINRISGAYVRSIENNVRFTGDLTGEVFSTSEYGKWLEDGTSPRDMKAALLNSPKAKIGKDGKKYVTIAFRHGTPGAVTMSAMPASVYNTVRKFEYSRRSEGLQPAGSNRYTWGGRYKEDFTGQRSHIDPHPGGGTLQQPGHVADGSKGYTWKTGLHTGMVRMGKPGHSQYFTFRRLSENSDPRSWMFPGTPPRPIREAVKENTEAEVLALIRRGFELDLYFMGMDGDGS